MQLLGGNCLSSVIARRETTKYPRTWVLLFVSSLPDFMTMRDCFVAGLLAMTGPGGVIASEAKQSAPTKICDLI